MATQLLQPGKVYRTRDFFQHGKNPTRLVMKLVKAGQLRQLRKGLYYAPELSAFGEVPPSEDVLLKAYFHGRPYLRTGPSAWSALGLGSTAVEVVPLVYNTTCTGFVRLGGRRFEFRRVRFPVKSTPEYFVVDLLENANRAGLDLMTVRSALQATIRVKRFDGKLLEAMASKYGTRATQELVSEALAVSSVAR